MATVWKSVDHSTYEFTPYPFENDWTDIAGVYLFAARLPNGDWNPLFIGEADSYERDLPGHEKWPWAALLGATHVLICTVAGKAKRETVEAEMIARLKPPLNSAPQAKTRDGALLRRA